jgi:hypothetical protein
VFSCWSLPHIDVPDVSSENPSMQRGAVAMIDALGFRGIWGESKKPSLEAFVTLKAVRAALKAEVSRYQKGLKPQAFPAGFPNLVNDPEVTVRFLSDTVVIAASVKPRRRAPRKEHEKAALDATGLDLPARSTAVDAFMRYVVCHCVCTALRAAALADKADRVPRYRVRRALCHRGQLHPRTRSR